MPVRDTVDSIPFWFFMQSIMQSFLLSKYALDAQFLTKTYCCHSLSDEHACADTNRIAVTNPSLTQSIMQSNCNRKARMAGWRIACNNTRSIRPAMTTPDVRLDS